MFETLETRRLMSVGSIAVVVDAGSMVISGTNGADTIVVEQTLDNGNGTVNVKVNGDAYLNISHVRVNAGEGNDWIELLGLNIPATVKGGQGDDNIRAVNPTGAPTKLLDGEMGQDHISSIKGSDILIGGEGKDTLITEQSVGARLHGENGVDNFFVFSSTKTIVDGGLAKDTLFCDQSSYDSMLADGMITVEKVIII